MELQKELSSSPMPPPNLHTQHRTHSDSFLPFVSCLQRQLYFCLVLTFCEFLNRWELVADIPYPLHRQPWREGRKYLFCAARISCTVGEPHEQLHNIWPALYLGIDVDIHLITAPEPGTREYTNAEIDPGELHLNGSQDHEHC